MKKILILASSILALVACGKFIPNESASLATVQTGDVTYDRVNNSIKMTGTLVRYGDCPILEGGFVYGTSADKMTNKIPLDISMGYWKKDFEATIEKPQTNVTYYAAFYVINQKGESRGETLSVKTSTYFKSLEVSIVSFEEGSFTGSDSDVYPYRLYFNVRCAYNMTDQLDQCGFGVRFYYSDGSISSTSSWRNYTWKNIPADGEVVSDTVGILFTETPVAFEVDLGALPKGQTQFIHDIYIKINLPAPTPASGT